MQRPCDTWKIGELAERTGLTVRALHHYESIGLLVPTLRAENNYRLYGKADLERLQQIVALKDLGFTLEQIRETLKGNVLSPLETIEMQMMRAKEQMQAQKDLVERLDGFTRLLKSRKSPTSEDLFHAIRLTQTADTYYTEEQGEAIRKRGEKLGRKGLMKAENDWTTLIAAVQKEMDKGTDPGSPRVKRLAKRWMELVNAFTGGDPEIAENLKRMYERDASAQHFGPPKEMGEYIGKALGK